MKFLQFIQDEGFTAVTFTPNGGKAVKLKLADVPTDEDLYKQMKLTPTTIQYYPFEREPYIHCQNENEVMKVKLHKIII
ncbi:hypothetical protein [Thalassobacillus hwangdonensis]|uniref:Uncharacterized protein n=1 Tax=Thalassobacillus hwangdonensis TaxID=546108 RepID=A0ABW3L287_9BACI